MNRKLVSGEVRKLLFSFVKLKREFNSLHYNISCILCFEAVACGLDNISNNQIKCATVSGIGLSFNYNR